MAVFSRTSTTTLLLESLHDPCNHEAWAALDQRMRPIIQGVALRLGLRAEDAADVAQETMTAFLRAYQSGEYMRGKGRLRDWICGIARNRVMDLHRARKARHESPAEHEAVGPLDDAMVRGLWDDEQRSVILEESLQELRAGSRMSERTIQVFDLVVVRGVPEREAAAQCGMSVPEVYVAKHRVTARLRQIMQELTAAYEKED